ncbi:PAS domain S-box protein [Nitrosomonas sp. Is24]|uniref:PAS domain-containing sensor histidine kinase n=1 Tax=Nitrosomonas sp. Is24 TaxID=3080533 RepID=UPI00294B1009|nr:PAS domain S-box protein [Nitrosomonas sp. Is24]MDV6341049.1 PAS domain S-box protein [Nitrosomonas sp. Is24]
MTEAIKNLSFKVLFDAMADAMVLIESDGRIVLMNPAALQLFGFSENELEGLTIDRPIAPRYRKQYQHYQALFFNKPVKLPMGSGTEFIVLDRSGQEMLLDVSLSPVELQQQLYVLITLTVPRQRQKTENALRESEERLRLAKQAAGFGIFDYNFKRSIVYWDEQMRRFWSGYTGKTISYEGFVAMIHPDDRADRQAAIDYAMDSASRGEYKAEYRVVDPVDGTERWISVVGRVYFEADCANRLVGIAQDVTEQKILRKKLGMQRDEAEKILKQQVAAHTASTIAHELNQPLTAISAYSEVVLHALQSNDLNVKNLKKALEGCVEQAQRAGHSLHELIAFLQQGELLAESLDLNDVIREALDIASNDGYERFRSKLNLEKNLPAVQCNRTQVQKVLVNFFRNAVEAMRTVDSPILTITTKAQTLNEKSIALVIVQDSGPGLDQTMAKRIFEPFFTTKPSGIGMRLTISRALIKDNGSQLWVDADTKTGAKFHFTLPFGP